jgi:GAF domain-containing protein
MSLSQADAGEVVAEALVAVATLARALHVRDARLGPTLEAIVARATTAHPAACDAGLILVTRGQLELVATSGPAPEAMDRWQQQTGEGPCVDAARTQDISIIADTRDEPRWPGFGAAALEWGVRSMLCAPLWIDERCFGALTLYSAEPGAFSRQDIQFVELFAALAALALAEALRAEQLRGAISTRDLIGQAKGILMERFNTDATRAFEILAKLSQESNTRVADLAHKLVKVEHPPQL